METIKEAVQAAENYLWGNDEVSNPASGEEPLAGVQGKGTATDPYDAGNAPKDVALQHAKDSEKYAAQMKNEKEEEAAAQHEPENRKPIPRGLVPDSGSSTTSAGGQLQSKEPPKIKTGIPVKSPPAEAGVLPTGPHSETTAMPTPSPSPTGGSTMSNKVPELPPKANPPPPILASNVTPGDGGAIGQGSERNAVAPEALPAPRIPPFPQVNDNVPSSQNTGAADSQAQAQAQTPPHDEHHVRSTGYAAEGGDFDAAGPGAGKEADRLLTEHHQDVTHGKKQADNEGYVTPTQHSKPSAAAKNGNNAGVNGSSNKNKTSSHHHAIPHPSISHLKDKLHIGKHQS
ncbi:hypothetical protein AJ78_02042 [Emergomyces pasteurianus Ep9510]|uniref:Uncharacterized protein n=1 Tax=Emergomyces pasteurianus Ep9510 TaxID=1447872 RepID=A0A1J9PNY5_9EURO|nr:hypothetical protein AJ78_02042 [Emergomyces pasteurianus Ep9510]